MLAWAAVKIYDIECPQLGKGDHLFEGGFLGLDNIGVFDRSAELPTGGYIEQSDGTSWMAMFCIYMISMALELSKEDPAYEDIFLKYV